MPSDFQGIEINSALQKATHYIVGLEYDVNNNIDFDIEAYIKDFTQLIAENKNQIFEDTPEFEYEPDYLKKEFIIENGIASGIDLSLQYNDNNRLTIWTVYSLGVVERLSLIHI